MGTHPKVDNTSHGEFWGSSNLLPVSTSREKEGSNTDDVFEFDVGVNKNLMACKISELMNLGGLEAATTQSLFSAMKETLGKCTNRRNDDVSQNFLSVLLLVIREMEQRFLNQNKSFRRQSTLYKSREERYQTKIKALETLATGTAQEIEIEKSKLGRVMKRHEKDLMRLKQEKEVCDAQVLSLVEELDFAKKSFEESFFKMKTEAEEIKKEQFNKILELEDLLTDSRNKVKDLENFSESKVVQWKTKEQGYKQFINSHIGSLQQLRMSSDSIKQEMLKIKTIYKDEFCRFGTNLKVLVDAAHSYHSLVEENRKLYNEVQDLKGNIRVYCRIRPFLRGQRSKKTIIDYIGENGELVVTNPTKSLKGTHRLFKFNKVFGLASTQEEVFLDIQPLIRSVLDGYNVCIFAYGQTGSGKTYTMTGPNEKSSLDWGVNFRALNDLFNISQSRYSCIAYEIGVQMVEIYNEQVRDLLCNDILPKNLGIWNTSLPNGLAVPDASMHPVNSITDVLELMNVGLTNRAVGATALNERSSRSHSILTVHVRGVELKTNAVLRGCLHLVDLAGSERVDRSEATGDRLREAQYINKSLSALGDVIFALAQKNPHVPYRNSKLTQVLQSSLGGQAKTLMFVQINPDVESYSETISTLKFSERVSGVELGAAKSNKEGTGVRELMDQVTYLKDVVARKDEELQLLKTNGNYKVKTPQSQRSPGPKNSYNLDKKSETGSQQSVDEFGVISEFSQQMNKEDPNEKTNIPLSLFGDAFASEKLNNRSDDEETESSMNSTREPSSKAPEKVNLQSKGAIQGTPSLSNSITKASGMDSYCPKRSLSAISKLSRK